MNDTFKKLPVNPYFIFLAQFREYLEKRGVRNIKVTTVARAAGKKWRQMSCSQKAAYIESAQMNREARKRIHTIKTEV
ncbi:high mobility group B protein 2 [Drosophila grimshawi]|uniref:high mobility group B protein 2 n=1 Tax=Drosophila grimshawi TaxID=7222 RepID=UPI001C931FD4|nr:high mobility group B protein 2 [Drosophila grimshawi]